MRYCMIVMKTPASALRGEQAKSIIRPYDPNTQRRVIRERLQALEIINERFARRFRMGLFNLLRRTPLILMSMLFVSSLTMNLLSWFLLPWITSLVAMAAFQLKLRVENSRRQSNELINRMLNLAVSAYGDAWKAIYPLEIEYIRSEMQIKFTNITAITER
ncbi:unnamed protein product [Ranitomeya imitator]|uniref:ABC transmembrane type-1 domain-containing protein n=1 Tax=Ranitomeya imitator TaxID=111125 RepID=A0ABN9LPM0_9NEOB|nr:unnamed protein product [Ranitomeya imitator]